MKDAGLTVLILGGYGTFGGRLARRLAGTPRLSLIVAGRSATKAAAFVASLSDQAGIRTTALDRTGDLASALGSLRPDILVDATGPFQTGGKDRYRVVEACLAIGIHYLDLADALEFVLGIRDFDSIAHARSLIVLSGLSTLPALSGAIVGALAEPFGRVEHIAIGLAPSPFADIGLSAIRAVTTYAGRPIALLCQGKPAHAHGLTDARRMTIAPPGRLPLHSRVFSLVEVPDLRLMPERTPGLTSIWTGAGTAPPLLHRGMIGMAWLVRLGLFRSLAPFATLFWTVTRTLRWGEDRGGLLVSVAGRLADGTDAERSFHLVAEGGDGPLIPCLAAESVIRGALAGRWPAPGARPAVDTVALTDILPLLQSLQVSTGYRLRTAETVTQPLYEQILGESWARLPPAVRALHDSTETQRFAGTASVDRGSGLLAQLLGRLIRFPAAGERIPVTVEFARAGGREIWRRDFAGRRFASVQSAGGGKSAHLVVERFGPVSVGLALVLDGDRLRIVVRRWSVLGLPLPLRLAPGGDTFESERDGRFEFHVEIAAPLTGLIVRYRGWLTRSSGPAAGPMAPMPLR